VSQPQRDPSSLQAAPGGFSLYWQRCTSTAASTASQLRGDSWFPDHHEAVGRLVRVNC
jgi:hypothetical protein